MADWGIANSGFFIERDGVKIELTERELFNAYRYQEHRDDIDTVTYMLEEKEIPEAVDREEYIEAVAEEARRQADKYDVDFDWAVDDVKEGILNKMILTAKSELSANEGIGSLEVSSKDALSEVEVVESGDVSLEDR